MTTGSDTTGSSAVAIRWLADGRRVARALLVEALGSTPLDAGASMYVDADGAVEGSVTDGCVESALYEECAAVLAGGPPRVLEYGISDDIAAGVGLMCGGTVRILVAELAESRDPFSAALTAAAAGLPAALGFSTTICDARRPFIGSARFGEAAEVVVDRPDRCLASQLLTERDAVLVSTHDPKFDEPALRSALASGAGYGGAMGSGLDIGHRRPEEAAISILGEIIARRTGRRGGLLCDTAGPIRGDRSDLETARQR